MSEKLPHHVGKEKVEVHDKGKYSTSCHKAA
jgi:hypothetical protein